MQVYTPPGYEKSNVSYPVFYLLHGAGDGNGFWISVERAGFILNNAIATGKAKPMIVIIPTGYTRPTGGFGHGLDVVSHGSGGGHNWSNWRDFLT